MSHSVVRALLVSCLLLPMTAPMRKVLAASPALAVVDLGEASFASTKTNETWATIHLDGRMEMDGQWVLTIHSDGRLVDAGGKLISSMAANGRIDSGLIIDPDGMVHTAEGTVIMQIAPDGVLLVRGKPTFVRINVSNPRVRRGAMFAFLLHRNWRG
ncbi:hypothetical protein LVJ94_05975 [Pendulispora rubella]|uniref:Uncharacterized protein n=1 Tax=Pendulispora rubella TaxID=2741070 RepID=A0ABZ2LAF9_9BACT